MGVLEELGLTEEELPPQSLIQPEADDFFQQLREGKFDLPAHPTHPDESDTGSVIDEIIGEAPEEATFKLGVDEPPAKKKSKGKRVAYSVACTLNLSGSDYQVQLLPPSSGYEKAYRLNKINAQKPTGYNVTQVDGEIICECSDFKFRHENCKHIKGLVDLGMLSTPHTSKRVGSGIFDG